MTYAQYTNFGGILDVLRRKSEILARHCRDLETDFDAITRSSNDNVLVGETQVRRHDVRHLLLPSHRHDPHGVELFKRMVIPALS